MPHSYFYFQDEQACLTGFTEFQLEDFEKVKKELLYNLGKEVYNEPFRLNPYSVKDLGKQFPFFKSVTLRSCEFQLSNGTNLFTFSVHKVVNNLDEDITYLYAYTWMPCIEINSPILFQKGLYMYFDYDNGTKIKEEIFTAEYHVEWPSILTLYCLDKKKVFAPF
jgi:hypothetical protein